MPFYFKCSYAPEFDSGLTSKPVGSLFPSSLPGFDPLGPLFCLNFTLFSLALRRNFLKESAYDRFSFLWECAFLQSLKQNPTEWNLLQIPEPFDNLGLSRPLMLA